MDFSDDQGGPEHGQKKSMNDKLHSIVVPVYNSRNTLSLLVDRVSKALEPLQGRFEILLVDDGSEDGSFEEIARLSRLHPFVSGFRLSRNFGHQAALIIGLENARGDYIAIIDDDLQDPPELLPEFFQRLYEDADVVYAVRRGRKESVFKKMLYAAFYRMLKLVSNLDIPLDAGDFCAMKRIVVAAILQFKEANPFLRGIRSWVGFKQVGVEYQREARLYGRSGYSFRKYFSLALSGILSFSYIPLRLATLMGILAALIGFGYAVLVVCLWLIKPFEVSGYASMVVLITFLGGVQLITIGILGEYLARLSDNVRRKSVAVIAEKTRENVS